jgi:glycosyltransferase involved in cell wall biosynthesis
MAQGFISGGVDLHLLTINTKKHFKPDEAVPEDFKKLSHYRSVYQDTDVKLRGALLNLLSSDSYFVSRFYFSDFEKALVEKLKSQQFDIIQIEGLFMGVYIPVIRKYSKAKIVLRAHNVEHLIWERHLKNEKPSLKKMYLSLQTKRLKKFEREAINAVDAVVTITDADKQFLEKEGFKKPYYNCITGVDVKNYSEGSAVKKKKTLFHFASMDWMPNQEAVRWFLANCWHDVLRAVPDAKLVLAGKHMPQEFLKLNEPNVLVIEKVNDGKSFYKEHEIMLVPLLSGSGLRIKIIEGMAYGKAIVSTSIGAEGINCSDKKNIIIADSAADFSAAVIDLLQHPEKIAKLESEALRFAEEQLDNSKVVKGLVNFYDHLLNG